MSSWSQILLVARRDFRQRALSKAFLVTMGFVVVAVVVAGPVLTALLEPSRDRTVGLVDEGSGTEEQVVQAFADALDATSEGVGLDVRTEDYDEESAAKKTKTDGEVDAVLVTSATSSEADETGDGAGGVGDPGDGATRIVWQTAADPELEAALQSALAAVARAQASAALGLTAEQAQSLVAPTPASTTIVDPVDEAEQIRQVVSFVALLLLYGSVLIFGQFVMLGVMEEKSSRVVEVLLSRVQAPHLLAGKVLGIGALAMLQILIVSLAALVAANQWLGDEAREAITVGLIVPLVGWFVLGFGFFSVLYAALGATVTRQEDAQSVALIPVVVVLPAYFVAILATNDPDSLVVRIGSLVPPLSPFVMPVRTANTEVPALEVGVSVVLLLVGTYVMIQVAGRLYSGAILRVGQKVSFREAWRGAQ